MKIKKYIVILMSVFSLALVAQDTIGIDTTVQMSGYIESGFKVSVVGGNVEFGDLKQYSNWEATEKIVHIKILDESLADGTSAPVKIILPDLQGGQKIYLRRNGTGTEIDEKVEITVRFDSKGEWGGPEEKQVNITNVETAYPIYLTINSNELKYIRGEWGPRKKRGTYQGSFTVRTEYQNI